MTHPDDRIAKFWTTTPDGTLHAALLFAGATETYCGMPAQQWPVASIPDDAPRCPQCLLITWEAGHRSNTIG